MKTHNLVQSLERGLDILEHIARAEDGMGVRELAASLDLKPPTVHNLMHTLTVRGYLRRDANPIRYRLGPTFANISRQWAPRALLAGADRELRALQAAWPDAVFTLAEASSHAVAVTLRMSPDQPGLIQRPIAQVLSPYASSSALLFQAFWPEDQRCAFELLHPFWDSAAEVWKTPDALAAFLDKVRRTGVAVAHFEGEALVKVSVPIQDSNKAIAAALGGSVAAKGLTATRRKGLIDLLKAAAGRMMKA